MMSSNNIRGNQKLKFILDGRQPNDKEEDDFNIDIIEDDDEQKQYTG